VFTNVIVSPTVADSDDGWNPKSTIATPRVAGPPARPVPPAGGTDGTTGAVVGGAGGGAPPLAVEIAMVPRISGWISQK
jgi:hypothetical protein